MAHTGAVLEVHWLRLSSMFVFDVRLPDHYIAGRVVCSFEVFCLFGPGHVALLFHMVENESRTDGQSMKSNRLKEYLKCLDFSDNFFYISCERTLSILRPAWEKKK